MFIGWFVTWVTGSAFVDIDFEQEKWKVQADPQVELKFIELAV